MKKIAIFTSALLLICGMTGCGKSSGGTAVYTDIDIHDENIIRHCIEQPADDPQPDSWLYTEIVSGDPVRLRYITSTETVGATEAETDEGAEPPIEIDVFDGAEINVDEAFGLRYPQSIMATFKSEFKKVTTEISLVEATPTHIVFRVTANENSSILKENNYVLRDTEKLYEVDVTTISHYLLSSDEITEELEEEIINGMLEEEEFSNRSDVELIALYTILPPDDFNYISEEKSFIASYTFQEGTVSTIYRVYGVFKDSQNHYYAASAAPAFDEDGAVSIKYKVLTGDVNKYEALGKYEFDNFDDAFECIEKIHQEALDTTVLTEFKTYTDTKSKQQETAESTDAE